MWLDSLIRAGFPSNVKIVCGFISIKHFWNNIVSLRVAEPLSLECKTSSVTSAPELQNEIIWVHCGCPGLLFANHSASGVCVVLVCIVFCLCCCIHIAQRVVRLSFHAGFLHLCLLPAAR